MVWIHVEKFSRKSVGGCMEDKEMLEELDKIYYLLNTVCGNCIIEDEERDSMQEAICSIQEKYKQDEKIIKEMAKYMVQKFPEYQLDEIYAELYNCHGLYRNWTRGDEEEIKDILKYFRKRCE